MDGPVMGTVSETLNEKRHTRAELEHLREFYIRWCNMHMTCGSTTATLSEKQESAQTLVDQARVLKEFFS